MNAPIETVTRECISCHEHKPHTEKYFELRRLRDRQDQPVYSWRGQCRDCRRKRLRATKDKERNPTPRKLAKGFCNRRDGSDTYTPGPKPCRLCCSLPWRVEGIRCAEPSCQLQWAPEPRPELRLRRFDRVG